MLTCVSVFDAAVGAYNRPFFTPSAGSAIRSFEDEVNRRSDENVMLRHPADFILYQLGSFDDLTGRFEIASSPIQLCRASDVISKEKNNVS